MSVSTGDYVPELVRPQVFVRLAPAQMGAMMMSINSVLCDNRLSSAPLTNPPKAAGLTDSITKLKHLIVQRRDLAPSDYQQVPTLLRRLRHLLRVYYDAKISRRKGPDFVYCDKPDMNDIALGLHEVGLTLQLAPGRLRALFQHAPDMDTFLFEEPIDIGKWRTAVYHRIEALEADPESTSEEGEAVEDLKDKADGDLSAFSMIYFVADVLVAWLLVSPRDAIEKQRSEKAMHLLVEYTSKPIYRKLDVFGDALTGALRPVYTNPALLTKFAQAGGLPGLFDDWSTANAKDGYCKDAVENLSPAAFEHQTEESLLGIMRGLMKKLEMDGDDVVLSPVFVRTIYQLRRQYGFEVFEKGAKLSKCTILFYFLHRRIAKKPEAYKSQQAIRNLLKRYRNIPETTHRRHTWALLPIYDRWECIELYGCCNPSCPELQALEALKSRRRRGERDPVVEARLERWGSESKACTNCREVSYCSATCQKADWSEHKVECRKKTQQERDEMEVDV